MLIRLAFILILLLARPAHAQNNNQAVPQKKVIRTLPMVKLGESPTYAKGMGRNVKHNAKPPKLDPYQWIVPTGSGTVARVWSGAGTNLTANLVKFNRFSVFVQREDEDEVQPEVRIPRKDLDAGSKVFVDAQEKEAQAAADQAWEELRAEMAEREASRASQPVGK